MATPKVLGPDGQLRETLIFSTTLENRFFSGTMDADTVDMQVSVRGGAFTNDPDLIVFEGTDWSVPSSVVYPSGLELLPGVNTILVRAVTASGAVTASASITVNLVQESDIGIVATSPTNIHVTQQDTSVLLEVEAITDTGFQGFNFYAAVDAGGGALGYQRINLETVTSSSTTEDLETIRTIEVDSDVAVDSNGDPLADPLFFRVTGAQENVDEVVIQSDFDEVISVAETVRELRTTVTLQAVRTIQTFAFDHDRSAGPSSTPATISIGAFAALTTEDLLYYVVTAVFFDPATNTEFESAFSPEVVGHPLRVTATIGNFPVVSRKKIVEDYITAVFRTNKQIRMEEGAPLRETVIDPFSAEAERLRFLLDFLHRARSPTQLLLIDDPAGTGQSAPVATSAYKLALKRAFMLTNNADVQALIDSAFDAYASNYGVFRRAGRAAQGEVTFFTTTRPTRTLQFPLGTVVSGGGQSFRTTRATQIPLNQIASFFDPVTGRFRVTVSVKATALGAAGNLGKGQVRRVESAISGVQVTNAAEMFGGKPQETNHQLVERARNRLASVDTGTVRGYLQVAADVPGVLKANVVGAGNPLMQRDLDSAGVHRGGKVDVWTQGDLVATVTDTFAFTFEIAQDIQFVVLGSPANLDFRAIDPELSLTNPIVEMLDFPLAGYELRNATTGDVYDLTGVTVTGFDTIQLDTTIPQPAVSITDVVLGAYRRRVGTTFVFPRQPVSEVESVEGVVSGSLPSTAFALFHPDPPLEKGRSSLAADYLQITPFTDDAGGLVPSGDLVDVTDESHVLIGEYPEFVDNLGAVFLTVRVWDSTRTIEYKGPNDPSGDPDFTIILGDQTTPLSIKRVETGDIASGATVLLDYSHDENFTVTYKTNLVVATVQAAVDASRHATADVIAKDAVPAPLVLRGTVVLNKGKDQAVVDPLLRTNLENLITNLRLGDPIRQSDVIGVIEDTDGVSYVIVPLTLMVRAEGSQVVREVLTTDLSSEIVQMISLSTAGVLVWLVKDALSAATTNGGGPETDFRGVFQDDIAMTLLAGSSLLTALGLGAGRAYIIGSSGASILGYSDDATLISEGFTDTVAARIERTANRILVSTATGDSPVNHEYDVTYIVGVDAGAKDIDPGAAEHITVGSFLFTYDEEQEE